MKLCFSVWRWLVVCFSFILFYLFFFSHGIWTCLFSHAAWSLTCFVSPISRSLMRYQYSHLCFLCFKNLFEICFNPFLHLGSLMDMGKGACMDSFGSYPLYSVLAIFLCSWYSSMAHIWFLISARGSHIRVVSGSSRVYSISVCPYWLRISSFWFIWWPLSSQQCWGIIVV